MNLEQLSTYAPYIQAAARGFIIQRRQNFGAVESSWEDMGPTDQFDQNFTYRIKPEPVWVPFFKPEHFEGLLGKTVRVKALSTFNLRLVVAVFTKNGNTYIQVGGDSATYTPPLFLRKYMFDNGDPCGVLEEQIPTTSPKKAGTPDPEFDDNGYEEDDEDEELDMENK